MIFAAKNYNISGGVSQLLHKMESDEVFQVKGLLGKGLGLRRQGTHIAFTGGTGALVFVDLAALLLRVNLGLIDPESIPLLSKGSSFRFVLYVSFPTRIDSLALDLFEGLAHVTKAKGLKNFELFIRISSEQNKGRWDESFIETEIGKYSNKKKREEELAKVYVCGPPPMTETFDRALTSMVLNGDLHKN